MEFDFSSFRNEKQLSFTSVIDTSFMTISYKKIRHESFFVTDAQHTRLKLMGYCLGMSCCFNSNASSFVGAYFFDEIFVVTNFVYITKTNSLTNFVDMIPTHCFLLIWWHFQLKEHEVQMFKSKSIQCNWLEHINALFSYCRSFIQQKFLVISVYRMQHHLFICVPVCS